jgi:hypothetical protein
MIEDILMENKNLLGILFNRGAAIACMLCIFIIFTFVPTDVLKQWFSSKVPIIAVLFLLVGVPLMFLGTIFGGGSYISLHKKHEEKDFFYRNKNDIIKICLGAIVGSIMTWLLTKVF